jgi:hypothetical protein
MDKEKRVPKLDPNGKYLIQDGGHIFPWTEKLAKRKDMRLYNHETGSGAPTPAEVENRVPIELNGKTFMVAEDLFETLTEMGKVFVGLQEENKALKTAAMEFEAKMERVTTDNLDLQEQIEKLTNPAPEADKKGKK